MFLVKLGGSVVTEKKTKGSFRADIVRRLAKEMKNFNGSIVIHGAGSFGHPIAIKYGLDKGYHGNRQGVAKVWRKVRELNSMVMNEFLNAGLPAVSLPPSAILSCENGEIKKFDKYLIEKYIDMGFLPISFGDVVFDSIKGFTICSGDELMRYFSEVFKPELAIFVTNVDGIFSSDKTLLKVLDKENEKKIEYWGKDATGGMKNKVNIGFEIAKLGTKVLIINGNIKGRLKKALEGKEVVGTWVRI